MKITYQRTAPDGAKGPVIVVTIPLVAAARRAAVDRFRRPASGGYQAKRIDQMSNAELKAELKRRLPCCGTAPEELARSATSR